MHLSDFRGPPHIKGDLLRGGNRREEAEQVYRAALDEATNQGSRHWAMRIALSLAALYQEQRRYDAIEPLLTPLVTQLSGSRAPLEVRQAREMLDNRA